jgi:cytidine deaminase
MMEATRRRFLVSAIAGTAAHAADDAFSAPPSSFGANGKAILDGVLADRRYRGQIRAADVAVLMKAERLSRDALMLKLIPVAKSFAHPPLSKYFVGAVALGNSGSLYLGCNIEIPRNMLGLAVHAEQATIANAFMSNEEGVEALTVGAAPCGHCRQFLSEVSPDVSMRLIMRDGSSVKLSELLPQAFGPKNLGFTQGSLPVKHTRMDLVSPSNDPLVIEAWKAACGAYSPYTRSPSGVALLTANGRTFAGSYIENAAFNPSLPPLEAALAGYFAAGRNAGEIQRAVLVERENAGISQRVTTQSALSALAPTVRLENVPLSSE